VGVRPVDRFAGDRVGEGRDRREAVGDDSKSSVGGVSTTPTTSERRSSRTLSRSIAASRRSNGTGFRFVVWWLADVTAQITVASGATRVPSRPFRYDAWNRVSTWCRPGNRT